MPVVRPARCARFLWMAAGLLLMMCAGEGQAADGFTTGGVLIAPPTGWTPEQTPVDFLDIVGLQTKARWRQLYRAPPPTPSSDRPRASFTLGGLIGDSFLALQAEDVQQFRNTTQDILGYCRVLGLGDKASPRLMSMSRLAAMARWVSLRQEAVDGHQELVRLLREQRDDDLAILVDLGVWMRVLEITSSVVADAPEPAVKPLCIGSLDLLKDMKQRFTQLSKSMQTHESLTNIGEVLDTLIRGWTAVGTRKPTQEFVVKTRDRLAGTMKRLTLK